MSLLIPSTMDNDIIPQYTKDVFPRPMTPLPSAQHYPQVKKHAPTNDGVWLKSIPRLKNINPKTPLGEPATSKLLINTKASDRKPVNRCSPEEIDRPLLNFILYNDQLLEICSLTNLPSNTKTKQKTKKLNNPLTLPPLEPFSRLSQKSLPFPPAHIPTT